MQNGLADVEHGSGALFSLFMLLTLWKQNFSRWPRMLSMARALCELHLELQNGLPCTIVVSGNSKGESEGFIPKTPASKETRRNKVSTKGIFCKKKIELDGNLQIDHVVASSSIVTGNSLMGICKLTT